MASEIPEVPSGWAFVAVAIVSAVLAWSLNLEPWAGAVFAAVGVLGLYLGKFTQMRKDRNG